ncbi:hypothetical protein HNQ91_005828 [Filimonas zeae]|uniref:Uncharacterized protein n=1 Tax=Filimonas zeae TaxID=1737353 RepID=A0A917J625_9BACT|nr:hypothetical protein [Filimonas zeae]MDR6342743.1 hypothetical protein [Filimonas zeae]GGH82530.1 hypothetical protein GCM10011379_56560 [Filimonas zeae]
MSTILPNEEKLLAYNGTDLILTNQRVSIEDRRLGDVNFFLEHIAAITTAQKGYKVLLVPGCLSVLTGLVLLTAGVSNQFQIFLIAGIIMLLFWWATKKSVLSIVSDKGVVSNVDVDIMTKDEIQSMIDDIEEARQSRIKDLTRERTVLVKRQPQEA